jgi:hypothetical protein
VIRARGAIQVQYAVPRPLLPVKRADLIAAFDAWRRGEASAIRVRVTVWGERLTEAEKRARVAQLGQLRHRPGRVERYADPFVTMCDHDGKRPELWPVWRIARQLGIVPVGIQERKTRHGWHRTIVWNRKFTPAETIALQLLLGSDRQREAFNLQRALTGTRSNRWNLLFTYKL